MAKKPTSSSDDDTPELLKRLREPFAVELVEWRVGSTNRRKWNDAPANDKPPPRGLPLCYIDARTVMERLDKVCGLDWQCVPTVESGANVCRIGIKIDGEWVWRGDGAGATGNVSREEEREMAVKGGFSDAFKRAAVQWGVGRYLYDIKANWIALDKFWNIPKEAYAELDALLPGGKPLDGKKDSRATYSKLEAGLRAAADEGMDEMQAFWKAQNAAIAKLPAGWRAELEKEKDRLKRVLEGLDEPAEAA
jgi:hypothetical protein